MGLVLLNKAIFWLFSFNEAFSLFLFSVFALSWTGMTMFSNSGFKGELFLFVTFNEVSVSLGYNVAIFFIIDEKFRDIFS